LVVAEDRLERGRTRSATATVDCIPARKGKAMSTTRSTIGELDRVSLVNPVDGWPVGTEGVVALVYPSYKVLEIDGIEESDDDDMLRYLPAVFDEDLRLVRKWAPPNS
jgi:hypothetical protein